MSEEHGQEHGADRPGREAARYRRQLREAEAELETLRGQLAVMRRREAERLATTAAGPDGRALVDGRDLWLHGVEVGALVDADGAVDAERVREAVQAIGADRPHLLRRAADYDGGVRAGIPRHVPGWREVIAGR